MGWFYRTRHGVFSIRPDGAGRFDVFFADEALGNYHSVINALEDLVGGATFWPSTGLNPAEAGLPDDLDDWLRIEP